ncbi:hypothetical protein [Pontimicrobium aquaticum]|uniref:Uncharacterized protein n=1 Tax=Pontimicrobium aquaticum TaxID=2565367 RepID=A0A4U0ESV0_9FLAO|nr:hypothetical protein [Pontimicrobium aquaticum]TJY34833.1 hypothetical protein E5167_11050 [Pontimicrobium aquaticum]
MNENLHTQLLFNKYGKISIEILINDDVYRVSNLIDENGVSRTLAISKFYRKNIPESFSKYDSNIMNGRLIGEELIKSGFQFKKTILSKSEVVLSENLKFRLKTESTKSYGQYSEIYIGFKNREFLYVQLFEILHPELSVENIKRNLKYDLVIKELIEKINLETI